MATTPTPAQPAAQSTQPQGPAISLGSLVQGAQDNAKRLLDQYNSNPVLQQNGISYIADPANPGRFIQVQGQTPAQKEQSSLDITKSEQAVSAPSVQNFPDALNAAISSGNYTATGQSGKQSREALISQLQAEYGNAIDPNQIAASVYNALPDTTGKTVSANDIKSQNDIQAVLTKAAPAVQAAVQGIQKIKDAVNQVNYDGSKYSPGYWLHRASLFEKSTGGDDPQIANIQSSMADIIETLKALTGTGRITQQEMDAVGNISIYDTKTQAMAKLNQYADLLNTATGTKSVDTSQSSTPSPQPSPSAGPASTSSSGTQQVGKYQVQVLP